MMFLSSELKYQLVIRVEKISGFWEIYNLITDHDSHNYLTDGFVLHNKEKK